MRFTIETGDFLRTLTVVQKVTAKKTVNPLLGSALLRKENEERYTLTASNGENQITVNVKLNLIEGEFVSVCLPIRILMQALGNLGKQTIIVDVSADCRHAAIEYLNGKFDFPVDAADSYPLLALARQATVGYDIETSVLLPALRSAAANCDVNNTLRPIFSAVALDCMQDGVTVVGTNGACLYMSSHTPGVPFLTAGSKPAVLLLPSGLAAIIDTAFRGAEKLHVSGYFNIIHFSAPNVDFLVTMVNGEYPNYRSVIPASQPYHITVSVSALMAAIKRVALFSDDTALVVLSCKDGNMNVSAQNVDYAKSGSERFDTVENTLPDGFRIGVNSQTFLRQLESIGTENVRIGLQDKKSPVLLREDNANSPLLLLQMPMLVS